MLRSRGPTIALAVSGNHGGGIGKRRAYYYSADRRAARTTGSHWSLTAAPLQSRGGPGLSATVRPNGCARRIAAWYSSEAFAARLLLYDGLVRSRRTATAPTGAFRSEAWM
jgi:hypothetical protein